MSDDHNMNQTDSGWRKRQIALDKKAENAREALKLALKALESMKKTLAEYAEPTTFNEDQAIIAVQEALAQPEQKSVQRDCKHEWIDDTKDKPQWRCAKCNCEYTKGQL
jgi:hypothetical protein